MGARGIEFDWKYIQMSIDSNISLVCSLALAYLYVVSHTSPKNLAPTSHSLPASLQVHYIVASAQVWMITRYDLYHTFRPAVLLLMFLSVYKAFVME